MNKRLIPKSFSILREGYSAHDFSSDLVAGIIVGIIALPLAIAFAIASGVKPEQGLYTAIIAGFVIAVFGGSRTQVSGPTGAFIVIVYGIVQQHGYEGLAVATLLAGILLVLMGLARMGVLLRFIPYPVTVGFTSGIAVIIFSSQVHDMLGLQMTSVPAEFIEKWSAFGAAMSTFNSYALAVGVVALGIIVGWPYVTKRIPGSLVAILLLTAATQVLHLPVETIGSRFGEVPNHLPAPVLRSLSWPLIVKMFSPAVTLALLAALESLLSAVVADGMMGTRHRSNMELIAQGIGNILSPMFNGIPATGAIARTAANIKNGARTPVAAMIHAVVLLLIMMLCGHWAALIPMPVLAAILVHVSYNMSEWRAFTKLVRTSPRGDVAVLFATFLLTVFIDLTVAIQVGVVLAAFLFLQRMSNATQVGLLTRDIQENALEGDDAVGLPAQAIPKGVEVFQIQGSLFFGAIEQFKDAMQQVEEPPKVLVIEMRSVIGIDATGLQALDDLHKRIKRKGSTLILSGPHSQPVVAMQQSGFLDAVGEDNIVGSLDEAFERAHRLLESRT
ncbi:MAG: sulfate permease [Ignavibacteriales bacterium]|nr:sulfate permease [Ignavibacteriales bacterium]